MLYALANARKEQKLVKEEQDEDVDLESRQIRKEYRSRVKQENDNQLSIKRNSQEKEVYNKFMIAKQQCLKKLQKKEKLICGLNGIKNMETLFGNAFNELMNRFENVEIECNRKWKTQAMSNNNSPNDSQSVSNISMMNNVIKDFEKINSLYNKYENEMSGNLKRIDNKLNEIKRSVESFIENKNGNGNGNGNDVSNINFQLFENDNKQANNEDKIERTKVGYWESEARMMYKTNGSRTHICGDLFDGSGQWSALEFELLKCCVIQWPNEILSPHRDIMYLSPNMAGTTSNSLKKCIVYINENGVYRINCVMKKTILKDNNQIQNENMTDKNHIVTHEPSKSNGRHEVAQLFVNNENVEFRPWDDGKPIPKIEITVVKSLKKNDKVYLMVSHGLPQTLEASLLIERLG